MTHYSSINVKKTASWNIYGAVSLQIIRYKGCHVIKISLLFITTFWKQILSSDLYFILFGNKNTEIKNLKNILRDFTYRRTLFYIFIHLYEE